MNINICYNIERGGIVLYKFKWENYEEEFRLSKIVCIHGIKLTNYIHLVLYYLEDKINLVLVPYNEFMEKYNKDIFVNNDDLVECDTVAVINSCNNNTVEIQFIKTAISALYFAERIYASERRYKYFQEEAMFPNVNYYHDFFCNYTIDGYWDEECINPASWYVNLGKRALDNDKFERWQSRVYGIDLIEAYDRRDGLQLKYFQKIIVVDERFLDILELIILKINGTDNYSKKLNSVLRMYFEVLCNFKNPDYTVILYCTLFETLLLKKDESNQRKKTSVRAACIVGNGLTKQHKEFIANQVYNFYRYRNLIIHDGLGLMDFENEHLLNYSIDRMKSIIFSIVKHIIINDIKEVKEIINVVEKNRDDDGLQEAFDYIDTEKFDNNPNYVPSNIFYY